MSTNWAWRCLVVLAALWAEAPANFAAPPSPGEPVPQVTGAGDALRQAWQDAYFARNYPKAAELLGRLCKRPDATPVDRYNLACVLAKLRKKPEAEAALREAIASGFADFALLVQDPDLTLLRDTETYQAVLEGWAELQDATIEGRLKAFEADAPGKHRIAKLDDLRVAMASATSVKGVAEAEVELRRAAKLWTDWVNPPAAAESKPRPAPWVLVWLPDEGDFQAWSKANFGSRTGSIGGLYTHDSLQLVARDTGPTMRHEFWHVLHYRDMSRRNQQHAIWVQEGLCSLIEDIGGTPETPTPGLSWRTNMARRMAETGTLPKLADLMATDPKKFMGGGSLGRYGASRAVFVYLQQQGKLSAWYAEYVGSFAADSTGKLATEQVLGKPLAQIDRDFRVWLRSLPVVGEAGLEAVSLPFDVDDGAGEGLVIANLTLEQSLALGVNSGDLIVGADGKPVRDRHDLAGVLQNKKGGDSVTLTLRFRGRDREKAFKLVARN